MEIEKGPGIKNQYLIINELDGNGKLDVTYRGTCIPDITSRKSRSLQTRSTLTNSVEIIRKLVEIFLPTGYPHSVSSDYIDYQIYDSVQAFSSSIATLFANRCVLSAVGVGDVSATSTSALFMKVIQETVGRMGTILFAWRFGSALEPECKKYRYIADLVNDSAMVFDCLSPMFPGSKNTKVFLLCISGLLRSICGVMAGGSRAALTQHFTDPQKGSIADVNAKDQSQETVITLMGMLTGSIIVGIVEGEGIEMWVTMFFLLSLHLWTNYQAVAHVVCRTLNRQRTNLVFSDIISSLPELESAASKDADTRQSISRLVLTPRQTSQRERILEWDGVLRWYSAISIRGTLEDEIVGYGEFCGFHDIIRYLPENTNINGLMSLTKEQGYIISYNILAATRRVVVHMALLGGEHENSRAEVRAWVHALLIAKHLHTARSSVYTGLADFSVIDTTCQQVCHIFDDLQIEKSLQLAGWEMEKPSVISTPSPRLLIGQESM